ncbi:eukaryotic translation initiation factor 3 subunit L-like [Oppia nitens]|uniref:eukaryotic translation initiation factor 3 subunit L-like n=1 Tax=Oppia nitens TaxID=1686743 RepID=UPI0023DC4B1F|nr:eukaryotic translation initiation factor 3 subunit L-like [Oppia nitens]
MSFYYEEYEEDFNNPSDPYVKDNLDSRPDGGYGQHMIPDLVQDFLLLLKKAIIERNVYDIQNLYENTFIKLSESYYSDSPWPEKEEVEHLMPEDNNIFIILYKELYYRHIYAKCQPTQDQRFDSYFNYCHLFNYILSSEKPVLLELPNQWLWDIIDEFIYQFQSFSIYKGKSQNRSAEDEELLAASPQVWNVHSVINVLHSLVDKSNINEQLKEYNSGRDPDQVAGEFGRQPLYKMLGYFSLIGLLRLHSLLGDYYQAIKVLENIDLNRQQLQMMATAPVLACQTTTFYYVGFAYIMMRRYSDAIRTFTNILVYLQRTRQMYHQYRTFQMDLIEKQTDQMYKLLSICLALHPQRIDETVLSHMNEKMSDSMLKLQRGDLKEFENVFKLSCPKFLSPVVGHYDNPLSNQPSGPKIDPWKHQMKVFLDEVKQQHPLMEIRSYLKLYTTMPIEKLANFVDLPEDEFKRNLLCFKHKMQNLVWTKGQSGLDGEFHSGSDVDFYIEKDMIHIADTKVARRYGDWFLRQIHKFDELYRIISNINV